MSVDNSGNCKPAFIADYNSIVLKAKYASTDLNSSWASESNKRSSVQTLQDACRNFKSKHGDISCRAEVNHQVKQASLGDVASACNAADAYLAPLSVPSNPAPLQFVSEAESDELEIQGELHSRIRFIVQDSSKVSELLRRNDENVVAISGQVGKATDHSVEFVLGDLLCAISKGSPNGTPYLYNGADIRIHRARYSAPGAGQPSVTMFSDNAQVGIGCFKASGKSIKLKELRKSFRGILKVDLAR